MIQDFETMTETGFEVQWYDNNGERAKVTRCDTVEELAQYLSRCLWGSIKGFKNNPGIYHNGKRWCLYEYTPVDEDGIPDNGK